jgi:endogenous inhibitor of DNA gyrase (YacG/DUF329 family)
MSAEMVIACPRCGAASVFAPSNRWRPFCSERCKLIDLGDWASERYRVPDAAPPAEAPPAEDSELP